MKRPIGPSERPAKILLVEDNPDARTALRRALEWFGHRVFQAGSSGEARAIWEHQEGDFQVLVTDVVLPGPTGTSLARELLDLAPDLRVLFISGYTDRDVRLPGNPEARTTFLEKPVTIRELGGAVERLLMRDPPARAESGSRPARDSVVPPPVSASGSRLPGH